MLCNQAKEKKVWIIGGSIPERDVDDKLYNTCVIINNTGNTSTYPTGSFHEGGGSNSGGSNNFGTGGSSGGVNTHGGSNAYG